MSTVSLTSLPAVSHVDILQFLKLEELKVITTVAKSFQGLLKSYPNVLWRAMTFSISDNIYSEEDRASRSITYVVDNNRLDTIEICQKLALPILSKQKIKSLIVRLHEFLAFDPSKIMGVVGRKNALHSLPATHRHHIQMLSSVYEKVMMKSDPSEMEIMKSYLLDADQGCGINHWFYAVRRLFLTFVAPWPYKLHFIPFRISENVKQITLRELRDPEFDSVLKEVVCTTWKEVYKAAMQHFTI